ncbi:unnamed protein product [Prorocentrum cordatum]|uniref:Uncharacterized protein n=1 Tax=Prorocentrum cordatum TaxID=2364126 RepID=A0ABN9W137_9DINO|nr:unnamed protein product [Polarella glacialis]
MNMTDVRVEKLEHLFEETGRNPNLANDALDTNIREYVQEYMANQPNYTHNAAQPDYAGTQHTHTDKRMLTTIIGNLDGLDDLVSATTWLQDKIEAMSGPRPSKVYAKGQYKGIIVAEFRDPGVRDLCVELLRRAGLKCGTKQVWASQDREPFDRAARSPCFGLKRLFRTEWSISDTVSVTEDLPYTITAGGEEAVTESKKKANDVVTRATSGMKGSVKGSAKGMAKGVPGRLGEKEMAPGDVSPALAVGTIAVMSSNRLRIQRVRAHTHAVYQPALDVETLVFEVGRRIHADTMPAVLVTL